jgi:purine-binding chemotaxis protein CheW
MKQNTSTQPKMNSSVTSNMLNSDQTKNILRKRAENLSIEIEKKTEEELIEVVCFELGDEKYGIESVYVREVYPLKNLTELPGLPTFILGIIAVRRRILSLVDLKVFFEISKKNKIKNNKIIILKNNEMEFAIVTDKVEGILTIPVNNLQTSLPTLTGIRQEFLKGITSDRLIVLDGNKLLQNKQLIVKQEF